MDRYVVVVTLPEASERSTQTCTGPVVVGRGSGATLRLLLSEYAKYVAVELRVALARLGIDLSPDTGDASDPVVSRKPATALTN